MPGPNELEGQAGFNDDLNKARALPCAVRIKALRKVVSDLYVHLGDKVLSEGSEMLTGEIVKNCDLLVTQKSEMVS